MKFIIFLLFISSCSALIVSRDIDESVIKSAIEKKLVYLGSDDNMLTNAHGLDDVPLEIGFQKLSVVNNAWINIDGWVFYADSTQFIANSKIMVGRLKKCYDESQILYCKIEIIKTFKADDKGKFHISVNKEKGLFLTCHFPEGGFFGQIYKLGDL